jgi:hypothetical protein
MLKGLVEREDFRYKKKEVRHAFQDDNKTLPISAMRMPCRKTIFHTPSVFHVCAGVWNRLRTSPSVRVVWKTMRTWTSKFHAEVDIRLGRYFSRTGELQ